MLILEHLRAIAVTTFRELIRSKVLYVVIFFAIMIIGIAALFGAFTIGDQVVVVKDFGLFSISIFSVAFAVISGASLLHKELSKKTIYNILSKPVHRYEFLLGKYLGILLTVALLIVLMGVGLLAFTFILEQRVDMLLLYAYAGIFLEMVILCAYAIFFSSLVVTPVLGGLFSFGVFLAGRSAEFLLYFVQNNVVTGFGEKILKVIYYALPHLTKLNASHDVVFADTAALTASRLGWGFAYAASYSGIVLVLATIIFKRREFN